METLLVMCSTAVFLPRVVSLACEGLVVRALPQCISVEGHEVWGRSRKVHVKDDEH